MRSRRLQREIDDLVAQGWRIEDERPDRVVMVNREIGSLASHVLVALLTIWWTFGLGNVLWGAYNYVNRSQRRVLWEDRDGCPNCGIEVAGDADYCPNCGEALGEPDGEFTCPDCEAIVREGSRYCRACGAKLADSMTDARSA
ncbi:zinc ribbon domain-containing protein [Natronobeatus ordinarius]|uniref:zinc ribbon domain-containing protein n=1 Tax=Natronobeatus ordinarius TaxID=2963433 RepID=UPI0020CFCCB4|nr:zinc ribbon domain-containing protein [Natronobeatus ordinarius]